MTNIDFKNESIPEIIKKRREYNKKIEENKQGFVLKEGTEIECFKCGLKLATINDTIFSGKKMSIKDFDLTDNVDSNRTASIRQCKCKNCKISLVASVELRASVSNFVKDRFKKAFIKAGLDPNKIDEL